MSFKVPVRELQTCKTMFVAQIKEWNREVLAGPETGERGRGRSAATPGSWGLCFVEGGGAIGGAELNHEVPHGGVPVVFLTVIGASPCGRPSPPPSGLRYVRFLRRRGLHPHHRP